MSDPQAEPFTIELRHADCDRCHRTFWDLELWAVMHVDGYFCETCRPLVARLGEFHAKSALSDMMRTNKIRLPTPNLNIFNVDRDD